METQLINTFRHLAALMFTGVLVIMLSTSVTGAGVSLGVNNDLQGRVLLTGHQLTPDKPKQFTVEAHNLGSTSFTGRLRLDVIDARNQTIFRTWSRPFELTPGSLTAHTFTFYTPERNGTFTAKTVLHYGTKRVSRTLPFNTSQHTVTSGFTVNNIRTGHDTVRLNIHAPADVHAFAVTINDDATRRFAQTRVTRHRGTQVIAVPYFPAIKDGTDATITISSIDGKYHYTKQVVLRRDAGFLTTLIHWLGNMARFA